MKQLLRKKISGFLFGALAIAFFGLTIPSLAQEENMPVTPPVETPLAADIAFTNLWAINSTPAPNGVVDFTVFYGNLGTSQAVTNVELKVTYDSKNLYDISLGDPSACQDDKTAVICRFNTLNPGESNTVGFTGTVVPTATPDAQIYFTASITADALENSVRNDFGTLAVTVTSVEKGGRMSGAGTANLEGGTLENAATKGNVWLFDVKNDPNWKTDTLSTAGLKFMIRGKEALAWTLNITDAGFRNSAIQSNYLKVLTVVNGLFVLGLLAIAAMWMFSLFIPRRILKQVIVLYGVAVLFVNFALPMNQLLIDGSNILQRTFIGATNISDMVDTPTYNDPNSIGYQNETGNLKQAASDKLSLNLGSAEQMTQDVAIGKLQQGFQTPTLTGTMVGSDGKVQTIDLNSTGNDPTLRLNTNQSIELTNETSFNPNQENRVFAFLLLLFTGGAYFGMALTFILRIVILWALMIVSPILFLLAIFRATRGYFYNWLTIYARWLLIGPLMALGIAMVVGIWKTVGMPVTSAYPGVGMFGQLTNVGFYLPGTELANSLSTTPQMMQYLLFLTMLYLPLFFAFMLTRQRMWGSSTTVVTERLGSDRTRFGALRTGETGAAKTLAPVEKIKELSTGLKDFLGSGLSRTTKSALPATLRSTETRGSALMAGTTALPEQLALTKVRDMLGLAAGENTESRNAHGKAIEKLASVSTMADSPERQTLMAVRHEIEERAGKGDADASRVMVEIQEKESAPMEAPVGAPMGAPMGAPVGAPTGEAQTNVTVQSDIKMEPSSAKASETKPVETTQTNKAELLEDEELEDEKIKSTDKAKDETEDLETNNKRRKKPTDQNE